MPTSNWSASAMSSMTPDCGRMEENARHLDERGALRPDLSVHEARDAMFALSSPELYDLLVLRRGWSLASYGTFVTRALTAALLP